MGLEQLDDDTLIHTFSLLPVASILALRQTCKRLNTVSRMRFIWQRACVDQVLSQGFPFPTRSLVNANAPELERSVQHALRLGDLWLSPTPPPPRALDFQATMGTGVSHVRFLVGHGGRYMITVYKGIWSMISCWEMVSTPATQVRKVADWCPKNTIFSGFAMNRKPDSEAALAISVQHGGGKQSIEILSVQHRKDGTDPSFRSLCNIATGFRPIALEGDFIAFSDEASETVIMNWRENTFALLKSSQRPVDERFQYNRCLEVVFCHQSVLVVRARSVELFHEPALRPAQGEFATYLPIGFHTFGWIDGVSVNTQTSPMPDINGALQAPAHPPLSIILRAESDDPWASDVHKIEQFVLHPNPAFAPPAVFDQEHEADGERPAPYLFPPVRAEHTSPTVRGFLRCRDIVLGPCGTAFWIQPRSARTAHLTGYDVHSSVAQVSDGFDPEAVSYQDGDQFPDTFARESLCAAVFAGPLQRAHPELTPRARTLWAQTKDGCNWTTFDYDEETGRVALGSSDGRVTVLDLV